MMIVEFDVNTMIFGWRDTQLSMHLYSSSSSSSSPSFTAWQPPMSEYHISFVVVLLLNDVVGKQTNKATKK